MKCVIIAPVGNFMDDLFIGIKEFPTEKVILITPEDKLDLAEKTQSELQKFKIPVQIKEIKGNIWEETFKAVAEIKNIEKDKKILVNVSTGDRDNRCAATSAAFVNGLKAFGIEGSEAFMLPVLKFSYYNMLTPKKLEILKLLEDENCCASFDELSKKSKMSLPLVSYHINGNLKSQGMKDLGLVETAEEKGRTRIRLTTLGRMLIKGYIN